MFEIVNDFFNYDSRDRIKGYDYNILSLHRNFHNSEIEYDIILNFSDDLTSDITLSNTNTRIISFIQSKPFIHDIINSYRSQTELEEQFIRDVNRSKLYINNHLVVNSSNALDYILYTYHKKAKNLIALCTQAICASIFEWLLFSLKDNFHIAECKAKRDKTAFLFIDNNKFIYRKKLRIFKLINGDDITIKHVKIHISIDNILDYRDSVMLEISIVHI